MTIAVGFGSEPERALRTLVRFLARMSQNVPPEGAGPREFAGTVRTADTMRSVRIGALLLAFRVGDGLAATTAAIRSIATEITAAHRMAVAYTGTFTFVHLVRVVTF